MQSSKISIWNPIIKTYIAGCGPGENYCDNKCIKDKDGDCKEDRWVSNHLTFLNIIPMYYIHCIIIRKKRNVLHFSDKHSTSYIFTKQVNTKHKCGDNTIFKSLANYIYAYYNFYTLHV